MTVFALVLAVAVVANTLRACPLDDAVHAPSAFARTMTIVILVVIHVGACACAATECAALSCATVIVATIVGVIIVRRLYLYHLVSQPTTFSTVAFSFAMLTNSVSLAYNACANE